jgi:SAM-dependent methyltransferase
VTPATAISGREQAFWDEHVPPLEQAISEYRRGPDPNTALMLDALEPLEGRRVLDFACGAGLTSAWLAARGASVTGIDISAASVARVRDVVASGLRRGVSAPSMRRWASTRYFVSRATASCGSRASFASGRSTNIPSSGATWRRSARRSGRSSCARRMTFVRILDRNLFRHRRPRARRLAARNDDWLLERGARTWSYHQVLCVAKPKAAL